MAISSYHILLLALAALGTWPCVSAGSPRQRKAAVIGLVAMAVAMSGSLSAMILGSVVMLAALPHCLEATAPGIAAHRVATCFAMIGVLTGRYLLNGVGFCGDIALPIFSFDGVPFVPMSSASAAFLEILLSCVLAYLAFALVLAAKMVLQRRSRACFEIIPMTLATFGMATNGL